jgi:hypothetical protein
MSIRITVFPCEKNKRVEDGLALKTTKYRRCRQSHDCKNSWSGADTTFECGSDKMI